MLSEIPLIQMLVLEFGHISPSAVEAVLDHLVIGFQSSPSVIWQAAFQTHLNPSLSMRATRTLTLAS